MNEPCTLAPGDVEVRASAGSKRVHGPRRPPPHPAAPQCLLHRELAGPAPSQKVQRWNSFEHFRLLRQWDCYAQQDAWPPFFLRRRSPVREVLAAPSRLVIALAESGVCTAFDQESGDPLCFLNVEADEVMRSLFLSQQALITISVFSGDVSQGLRVRSTPLASIWAGRPQQAWRPLFTSEVLHWPGFVEFCDVNDVAVTCCAETRRYKVWDLCAPLQPRFFIDSHRVRDLKIANGAILLTMRGRREGELHLRVLDLQHGDCVREVCVSQQGGDGWELVELFGRHLLTKVPGGPLCITNVVSGVAREVDAARFPAPEAFIHLPFNHSFLAFWEAHGAQLWSFHGERLSTLVGASLSTTANTVFVSDPQDLMFVYSPPTSSTNQVSSLQANLAEAAARQHERSETGGAATVNGGIRADVSTSGNGSSIHAGSSRQDTTHLGCVRVFDLLTGRQVAVVQPPPPAGSSIDGHSPGTIASAAGAALKHVTAIFYDQTTHRVYTGTADGKVQAWGL